MENKPRSLWLDSTGVTATPRKFPVPLLVGLHGQVGAGKTTVAKALERLKGYRRFAYANKLKEACAALLGVSREELDDSAFKQSHNPTFDMTNRKFLQEVGEGFRRIFGEDFWIKTLDNDPLFNQYLEADQAVVVEDVRYVNEIAHIHSRGGVVLLVDGNWTPEAREAAAGHDSENDLSILCDGVINNGQDTDIHEQVMHTFHLLGVRGVKFDVCTTIHTNG